MRTQKFVFAAMMIFLFGFMFFKPYPNLSSLSSSLKTLPTENLTSIESLAEYEKQQQQQIRNLRFEVESLRADLYKTNLFYGTIMPLVSATTFALFFALMFGSKFEKEEAAKE